MKKLFSAFLALLLLGLMPQALAEAPQNAKTPVLEHYLLLGFDFWGDERIGVSFSDTNILATIDRANGRLMVTSLLRDTYVERPGGKWGRLNSVVKELGFDAMLETISLNYKVPVTRYMAIGTKGLKKVIDAMGGVEITMTAQEAEHLSTISGIGGAGTYTVGGHAAVQYMRIRKLAGHDFSRTERQRKVLMEIFAKLQNLTLAETLKVTQALFAEVETNMKVTDLLEAASLVYSLRNAELETLMLPLQDAHTTETIHGMSVLTLDWEKNREALGIFLNGTE